MTRRSLPLAAGTIMSFMFGTAFADVPPAMDRVPADAAIVISVKNIGQFKSGIEALAKAIGVPAEAMGPMTKMNDVLNLPGADAAGSAAVGVMSTDAGDEDKPDTIAVIPVKDYAAFVKNFGGAGTGLEELKIDNKPVFVKNLDGGFAAIGDKKDQVEKFAGKPGNGKALEALMGPTGKAIAESDDMVVFANIAKLGDKIKEGTEKMKEQAAMPLAMAGPGGEEMLAAVEHFMTVFARDASAGIAGVKASAAGITIDLGTTFKEGTEYAGYFNSKGNASGLTAALPKQDFLFSLALDTSNPGLKAMFKKIKEAAAKMQPKDDKAPGMFPTDFVDKADGIAFQIGNPPALVGGLFLQTVAYIKTSSAAALTKEFKDSLKGFNGKTAGGMTYTTAYESGVKAGSGTADAWSIKMAADPENPEAAQLSQVNGMLFGPGGLGGYATTTDTGIVMTYAKNADLLEKAVAASKSGAGMGTDPDVKAIAAGLPTDRAFEGYLGTKSVMEAILGVMGLMGQAPNFNPPDDVPPVGMAATSAGGGVRFTIVVPTKVITTFQAFGKAMDMGGGDEEKPDPAAGKAGQPKF